jgi:hypothetical protein
MGEIRKVHKVFVGKPEPLVWPRRRGEYNNRKDIKVTGCDDGVWTHQAQDRVQ